MLKELIGKLFKKKEYSITIDALELKEKSFDLMEKAKDVLDRYQIPYKLDETQDTFELNVKHTIDKNCKIEILQWFYLNNGKEYNPNYSFGASVLYNDGYKKVSYDKYPFLKEILSVLGVDNISVVESTIDKIVENNPLSKDENDIKMYDESLKMLSGEWNVAIVSSSKFFEAACEKEEFLYEL